MPASARNACARYSCTVRRLSLATVLPVAGGLALLAHPLLTAWLGPSFASTTAIVQILAFVVIVRVGCSTSSVILKGAGMHRQLTTLVGLMAIGNLALSLALVRSLGIVGVAIGTAVPVAMVAACGLVPMACRRVAAVFRRALPERALASAVAGCHRGAGLD